MCERCKTEFKISGRYAEPDEQTQCKSSEENEPRCPENGLYVVSDQHVEDHLCDDHLTDERNAYFRGKGELLALAGLEEGVQFEKIEESSKCDYYIQGPPLRSCGERATHAKIVIDVYVLCPFHAEDMGFSIHTN